jgi:serine/threonine protein phosphatase PrpC
MPWQAVAVSAKGTKHEISKQPCQDYGDYKLLSDGQVIIGAVSDGMGSARHSEIGSKLAVRVALEELESKNWISRPELNEEAKVIFDTIIKEIRKAFERHAAVEGYSVQMLACTLLTFVATSEWLIAMQIGDGFIVVQTDKNLQLLFKPDKGEYANETTSVTSPNVYEEAKISLTTNSYSFICVSTDGVENLSLIKRENWKPFDKFFSPLQRHMQSDESLEKKKEDLEKFLNSEKLNQKTDDDKTLLLCVYKHSEILGKQEQEIHQEQNHQEFSDGSSQEDQQLNIKVDTRKENSESNSSEPAQGQTLPSTDEQIELLSELEDSQTSKASNLLEQHNVSNEIQTGVHTDDQLENQKAIEP